MWWIVVLACLVTLLCYWLLPKVGFYMIPINLLAALVIQASEKIAFALSEFFGTVIECFVSLLLGSLILRIGTGLMNWFWLLCLLVLWRIVRWNRFQKMLEPLSKAAAEFQTNFLGSGPAPAIPSANAFRVIRLFGTAIAVILCFLIVNQWR